MNIRPAPLLLLLAATLGVGALAGYRAGARENTARPPAVPTTQTPPPAAPRAKEESAAPRDRNRADDEASLRLTLGRTEPATLRTRIQRLLVSPRRDGELRLALEMLARRDPAAALELAGREAVLPVRTFLVAGVVGGWMAHDPAAALAWVAVAGNSEYADAAFAELAQLEPGAALRLAEALPAEPREFRWNALRAVLEGRLLDGGYAEGIALVTRAAEPALREFLAAQLADAWVRTEPAAAAQWVATLPESAGRAKIFTHVASLWAAQAPQAAADFALTLPAGESRQQMLLHALVEWIGKDLAAASRWVDGLAPSPQNDPAVTAIATDPTLVRINPEVAWNWAESLASREARLRALGDVATLWAAQDAAAARRRIDATAALRPDERAALLEALALPVSSP
jgi:hypothetical protein